VSRFPAESAEPLKPSKPPKPAHLISTAAAAERLGVSPNTVRSLIAQGLIKGYKVGRLIKLDSEAVEDFISEIATGA
jgi:excisionase family DNA binding protein